MTAQNFNASTQLMLDDLLANLNYNNICIPPFNNDPYVVATKARNSTRIQILNGKDLLWWNIKLEIQRLKLRKNRNMIKKITDKVWNSEQMRPKREVFESLAKDANIINKNIKLVIDDTLSRISQINIPQVTNNPLFDDFYNGVNFSNNDNNDLESLIFPPSY
jgi:hypothetical protein